MKVYGSGSNVLYDYYIDAHPLSRIKLKSEKL